MRQILYWAGWAAGCVCAMADTTAGKPVAADVPILPLSIPGYELRVLDVRKPVVFNINGSSVEGSLPVFVYYPTPSQAQAESLLRHASDDLTRLGQKPEWTGEELRQVVSELDAAIGLLQKKS